MPTRNSFAPARFLRRGSLPGAGLRRAFGPTSRRRRMPPTSRHVSTELAPAGAEPAPLVPEHVQACVGGMAGGVYPCSNIDLVEFMTHATFGTTAAHRQDQQSLGLDRSR